jgi:hypothetical protein
MEEMVKVQQGGLMEETLRWGKQAKGKRRMGRRVWSGLMLPVYQEGSLGGKMHCRDLLCDM